MKKTLLILLCLLLCLLCAPALSEEADELTFPADLVEIDREAFMDNTSIGQVVLHEGVTSIGERAFAFSSAGKVNLPVSLKELADDAFEGCENVHLYVYNLSYAHDWCKAHDIPYTVVDGIVKPTDVPARQPLDYGDAGYAVLASDVIRIGVPAVSLGGGRFTLTADEALSPGDVVHLSAGGTEDLYKIASVDQNADGTVTITEDPDITLSEMYDAIYLDTYLVNGLVSRDLDVDRNLNVIDGSFSLAFGPAELSASMTMSIRVKCIYDKKFGEDDIEMEVYTEASGRCGVYAGLDADTWKTGVYPEIPIYSGTVIIPGLNLPAQLTVSVPFHMILKGGSTMSFGFNNKSGFRYTPETGVEQIDEKTSDAVLEPTGALEISVGPEFSLGLNLFKDTLSAKVSGQVGGKAVGELETPSYGGSTADPEDSIHACKACLDLELFVFGKVRGAIQYDLTKNVSGSLLDVTMHAIELALDKPSVILCSTGGSAVQARTEDGAIPDSIPEVWLKPSMDGRYISGVQVTHEDCAEPLVFTAVAYTDEARLVGVDMGNGEYTFYLMLASSGTGGYEALVFCVKDGKMEVLKSFTYYDFSDNIRFDGSFTSNSDFTGVISPSNITVHGHVNEVFDFDERTGKKIWNISLGDLEHMLNDSGAYDLILYSSNDCLGSWDRFGGTRTRYVLRDGELVLDEQWYEVYDSTVSYGN